MKRLGLVLAALACCAVLEFAPMAGAVSKVPSRVTIHAHKGSNPPRMSGTVHTDRRKHFCERDRRVKLLYDDGGGLRAVGADNSTSDSGYWVLYYNGGPKLPKGQYAAFVTRKAGHGIICQHDTSQIITIR